MTEKHSFFSPLDGQGLRKRLWKTGGLLAVFVVTFIVMNVFFLPAKKAVSNRDLGLDFLAFYYAGNCVHAGHYHDLYDLNRTKQFDAQVAKNEQLNLEKGFGPFWNPPFVAWMFEPLSQMSFLNARLVWWAFGFCCVGIALVMMYHMIDGPWQTRMLVPLFVMLSMPFFEAFTHGQNTFFSLLLLTITVWFWRDRQALAAGLICGLLFYKPQLGAVVAAVLCISQGWRAGVGVLFTVGLLGFFTYDVMPGSLHQFFFDMPKNLTLMQQSHNDYIWERHVTFRTFWRILVQGWNKGPDRIGVLIGWAICELALLAGLATVVVKTFRARASASQTDRLIAASIAAMPLLMPFYFDYDLLLISLSAALYVADRQREATPISELNWEDRWLPRVWTILFFLLEVATIIEPYTRVQPLVPLMAVLAILLIRRALRPQKPVAQPTVIHPFITAMAA